MNITLTVYLLDTYWNRLKVFGTGGGRVGERKVNLLEESPGFVGKK